jgi:hypothetical protein
MDHFSQFIELWIVLDGVNLVENVEDIISWKLTNNGQNYAINVGSRLWVFRCCSVL